MPPNTPVIGSARPLAPGKTLELAEDRPSGTPLRPSGTVFVTQSSPPQPVAAAPPVAPQTPVFPPAYHPTPAPGAWHPPSPATSPPGLWQPSRAAERPSAPPAAPTPAATPSAGAAPLGTEPPPGTTGARAQASRAIDRVFGELGGFIAHVATRLNASLVRSDQVVAVQGFCFLARESEAGRIWFQIGAHPMDALVVDLQRNCYVRWSDPVDPIEPTGYLRGLLLEAVRAAGTSASSGPPRR